MLGEVQGRKKYNRANQTGSQKMLIVLSKIAKHFTKNGMIVYKQRYAPINKNGRPPHTGPIPTTP